MGQIKGQKKSIRKTGTTVKVEKLFHRIPVRRNIFMKNDKKEIQKTYTTLMAYALMSQARFIVQSSVKKSQFQIGDHFFFSNIFQYCFFYTKKPSNFLSEVSQ